MKFVILFFLSVSFFAGDIFAGTKDTTLTGDLNHDSMVDIVKVSFTSNDDGMYSYLEGDFFVDINGSVYKDKCEQVDIFKVSLVDIDYLNMGETVMVSCFGLGDQGEYFFYTLKSKEVVSLGSIKAWGSAEVKGGGKILVNDWMGFWSMQSEYFFNKETNKIEINRKDSYDVNVEGIVKSSFKLLKSREDNSEVVQTLKSGTRVTLLKCDTKPVCKNEAGYEDEYDCDWYLMKTAGGTEGWVRMKDFRDNVSDLPWAG